MKRDDLALELAMRLHDVPTFTHVQRVAARTERAFAEQQLAHPSMAAQYVDRARVAFLSVAYLHDAVEDTPMTVEVVEALFGKEIGDAVDAISRDFGETYTEYVERVKTNPIARIVKLADIEDHLDPAQAATLRPSLEKRYLKAREALKLD